MDYQFYQNTVDVIIPDVLRSIPNALTQAIRNFAKNLELWLCESMLGVPEQLAQIKTSAVSAFCQTLRRYTSLNHLAQAARAVLQNGAQISQMLNDLNRVDFHNVQVSRAVNLICMIHLFTYDTQFLCRNKPLGLVNVLRLWCSVWRMISRLHCSNKVRWSNGPAGYNWLSSPPWRSTMASRHTRVPHDNFCSNGASIVP